MTQDTFGMVRFGASRLLRSFQNGPKKVIQKEYNAFR